MRTRRLRGRGGWEIEASEGLDGAKGRGGWERQCDNEDVREGRAWGMSRSFFVRLVHN